MFYVDADCRLFIDYIETLIDILEFKTPLFITTSQSAYNTFGFFKDDLSFEIKKTLLQKCLFWVIKKINTPKF